MDPAKMAAAMKDPAKMAEMKNMMMANAIVIEDEYGEKFEFFKMGEMAVPLALLARKDGRKFRDISQTKMRNDDIVLVSYPKTGTHWVCNLMHFMTQTGPLDGMVSLAPPLLELYTEEEIEAVASPRILPTHMKPKMMPPDMFKNGCKTIVLCRNPKDTATSLFHMLKKDKSMGEFKLSWNCFIENWMKGNLPPFDYFDYYNEWQKFLGDNKDANILMVNYEDLKQNGVAELRRISTYLGLDLSDERLQQVLDKCSIGNLKADVANGKIDTPLKDENGQSILYRKGIVGDWKNHFTVAQSEQLDVVVKEKFNDSIFKCRTDFL